MSAFLTKEQENTATIDELVTSHDPLVLKMARAFTRYGLDMEDLVQEGRIGLLIAAKKFDPSQGVRFSTYATFWVRQQMREATINQTNVVRPCSSVKARSEFFRRRPHTYESMDAPLLDGGGMAYGDTFVSEDPSPEEVAMRSLDGERLGVRLKKALRRLDGRAMTIIRGRFLDDERESLESLGNRFGISKERARQIEHAAIRRLRERLAAGSGA